MSTQNYFTQLVNGVVTRALTALAGGATDANKVPQLDENGQLKQAMMPTGIAADIFTGTGSGVLTASMLVSIIDSSGPKIVAADNSNTRPALGYVTAGFADGDTVTAYKYGTISGFTGLTTGGKVFLSTVGGITQTPPTSGISQVIGTASSTTQIEFDPQQYYQL